MFSKACEYGIRAAIHIGHKSKQGERVSLRAIAKAIDSPVAFTAKILQALAKSKIIISTKGATGGYEISNTIDSKITLFQIVNAIDGDNIYNGCGLGLKQCNASKPCPLHHHFVDVRADLKKMLKSTTIQDMSEDMNIGTYYLNRK